MRKHKMHFIQVSASDICIAFKYLQAPGSQLKQQVSRPAYGKAVIK